MLGAKSPVVKAHGASDAKTVYFTLKQIRTMVDGRMVEDFTKYWEDLSAKKRLKATQTHLRSSCKRLYKQTKNR